MTTGRRARTLARVYAVIIGASVVLTGPSARC